MLNLSHFFLKMHGNLPKQTLKKIYKMMTLGLKTINGKLNAFGEINIDIYVTFNIVFGFCNAKLSQNAYS